MELDFLTNFGVEESSNYIKAIHCYTGPETFYICGAATYGFENQFKSKEMMALWVKDLVRDENDLSIFWKIFDALRTPYEFENKNKFERRQEEIIEQLFRSKWEKVDKDIFIKYRSDIDLIEGRMK